MSTPEPPVSLAVSVTVTSWLTYAAGTSSVVTGAVVSTVKVLVPEPELPAESPCVTWAV